MSGKNALELKSFVSLLKTNDLLFNAWKSESQATYRLLITFTYWLTFHYIYACEYSWF